MTFKTSSSLRLLAASTLAIALASAAGAKEPERVHVPGGLLMPESLTSSADGSIFVGSMNEGSVYKAEPGAEEANAEPFIASHAAGLASVFGVFAHDASSTLWVCSGTLAFGPPQPDAPPPPPASLNGFDLATGEHKATYQFPTDGGSCNDIAVGPDGSVYATDTPNMEVVRLAPGASELEVWAGDGAFGPDGGVLDGIAVVGGRVVVNTLATSKLFGVDVEEDGSAGAVVEYALDREIVRPDGMRAYGESGLLIAEGGANRISHVVLEGDSGTVTTVGEGLSGAVSVTVVGSTAYALEGQFGAMGGGPGAEPPPIYAIGFPAP